MPIKQVCVLITFCKHTHGVMKGNALEIVDSLRHRLPGVPRDCQCCSQVMEHDDASRGLNRWLWDRKEESSNASISRRSECGNTQYVL